MAEGMAALYFPRRLSIILPALACIEGEVYGLKHNCIGAMFSFCEELRSLGESISPEELKKIFTDDEIREWRNFMEKELPDIFLEMESFIHRFYDSCQTFRQYNFLNITTQNTPSRKRLQQFFTDRAEMIAREYRKKEKKQ